MTIVKYRDEFHDQIISIWERSVRATHHFLKDGDIEYFKSIVGKIDFDLFDVYCAFSNENKLAGFIGVAENKIEMLFLDPEFFGQGLGKLLMTFAVKELKATEVDVNEENENAVRFYQKFGFVTYDRTEKDSEGKDYPILKMKLVTSVR